MHKALNPRDDVERLYVSKKEGRNGLARNEDSIDASIQRLEDYIEKCGERLITASKNNTDNTKNLWNIKVTFIPIVIGNLGTITKGLWKRQEDLEIRVRVETIQTITLLRSAGILRRFLENREELLLLKLQRKTIDQRWCEKLTWENNNNDDNNNSKLQTVKISLERSWIFFKEAQIKFIRTNYVKAK